MIVDDYAPFRQVVRTVLKPLEAEFAECASGREALNQYALFEPDIVLMDLAMAGQDGLVTTTELKARFPKATVLILTQFDDPELRAAAQAAGAYAYVLKDNLWDLFALLGGAGGPSPQTPGT
jgi:DNA-binding NarL/FixJ family response regulator